MKGNTMKRRAPTSMLVLTLLAAARKKGLRRSF